MSDVHSATYARLSSAPAFSTPITWQPIESSGYRPLLVRERAPARPPSAALSASYPRAGQCVGRAYVRGTLQSTFGPSKSVGQNSLFCGSVGPDPSRNSAAQHQISASRHKKNEPTRTKKETKPHQPPKTRTRPHPY